MQLPLTLFVLRHEFAGIFPNANMHFAFFIIS